MNPLSLALRQGGVEPLTPTLTRALSAPPGGAASARMTARRSTRCEETMVMKRCTGLPGILLLAATLAACAGDGQPDPMSWPGRGTFSSGGPAATLLAEQDELPGSPRVVRALGRISGSTTTLLAQSVALEDQGTLSQVDLTPLTRQQVDRERVLRPGRACCR